MLYKRLALILGSLAFSGILIFALVRDPLRWPTLQTASAALVAAEPPRQEVVGNIEAPTLSSISSPSATCSRPTPGTGACYIQWNYLYVTAASSSYIISMTVSIDNQIRAYHSGFFQTSMYIPGDMTQPGYKVTCGFPQGNFGLGNIYPYTIRARETTGTSAANYGSVTCPADVVTIFLPAIQKQ
jgi:hypothetical protein